MGPKEAFKASMALAAFGANRFDARRSYEWKVTLGFWFVLIAAIGTFRVSEIPWWYGPVAGLMYALRITMVRWRNSEDQSLMDHDRGQAIGVGIKIGLEAWTKDQPIFLGLSAWAKKNRNMLNRLPDWSATFQIAVTVILIFAVYRYCQTEPMIRNGVWFGFGPI
jgi:hypothetical protein